MPDNDPGDRPPAAQEREELALAARYAPLIHLDRLDPFLPSFAGYTIFRRDGQSTSFPRRVTLRPQPPRLGEREARELANYFPDGRLPEVPDITAAFVVEYAIWWHWDIQHLYELEHAWSYVGADGRLLYAEASWHGGYFPMLWRGETPRRGDRPLVYSQPGKHAFAPDPSLFTATVRAREQLREACYSRAGSGGVLCKDDLFGDQVAKDATRDALATAYLKARAFDPTFDFTQAVALDEPTLVPWPALRDWIPGRLDRILTDLNERQAR